VTLTVPGTGTTPPPATGGTTPPAAGGDTTTKPAAGDDDDKPAAAAAGTDGTDGDDGTNGTDGNDANDDSPSATAGESDGPVARFTAAAATLPFTGLALGALVLIALVALTFGAMAHRAGRDKRRDPAR
jgi:hypothetical protein